MQALQTTTKCYFCTTYAYEVYEYTRVVSIEKYAELGSTYTLMIYYRYRTVVVTAAVRPSCTTGINYMDIPTGVLTRCFRRYVLNEPLAASHLRHGTGVIEGRDCHVVFDYRPRLDALAAVNPQPKPTRGATNGGIFVENTDVST